jgi:endonuclease/exonuclease/phosphatase family metal-dependent hydrolase
MIGEVTFAVIGALLLLADIRTFASTFQQTFYGNPNTQLGAMAGAVFATSFLAPLVGLRFGPRRSVALSGAILGVSTLLATISRNNVADLVLTVIGVAAGTWWLSLFHASRPVDRPSPLPVAVPIALAADVALRAAFRTVPVVDVTLAVAGPLVLVAALVFFAAGISSLGGERIWTRPGARGALALVALPALFFVAETGGTNGAQVALASGLGLGPEGARSTQLGMVLVGLGLASGALLLSRRHPRGVSAALACAVGAAMLWTHTPIVSLLGGLVLAAGVVLAGAAIPAAPLVATRSPLVVTLTVALGWLVFVGTAFGFYAFWAYQPAAWGATAVVVAGALLVPGLTLPAWRALPIALVPLVVAVPLLALVLTPMPPAPEQPRNNFRVMTYNIHQGFNAGQIPSLDQLVDVIARESPDVLLLQEVVRGWMIDEQHDSLGVLAERLGMQYVFGPNIGDLFGNAILSRFPMTDVRRVRFAAEPSLRHQPRGAIGVRIGDVLIVTTHLDDIPDSSAIRQEQVRTILREWDGERIAIIAGDMNAAPADLEMSLLAEAGFGDLGEPAGATTALSDPPRRIDYIWAIGLIGGAPRTVPALSASDHLPLVVNVTRPSRP